MTEHIFRLVGVTVLAAIPHFGAATGLGRLNDPHGPSWRRNGGITGQGGAAKLIMPHAGLEHGIHRCANVWGTSVESSAKRHKLTTGTVDCVIDRTTYLFWPINLR